MEASSKLPSIQLLRGLAALAVAAVHLWFGFAVYIESREAEPGWADQLAQAAVAAFFVVSGAVMVTSSRPLFGTPSGPLIFWRRRAVRVLPPYWIATILLAGVMLWVGLPFDWRDLARSLAFIADDGAAVPPLPFLWPGWTLFYELGFYAVFGAVVLAHRERAIGSAAIVLIALVLSAEVLPFEPHPVGAFARPVLLLFVVGMAAGLFLDAGNAVPQTLRVLAALGAAGAIVLMPDAPRGGLGWDWLAWAGLPGAFAFIAVAGGPIPARLARPSVVFGDLSYALYLLHVPFAHAWMQLFNVWLGHPGGALGYLAGGLPLLLALSFAFHRGVERPMTRALNRWLEPRLPPPTSPA